MPIKSYSKFFAQLQESIFRLRSAKRLTRPQRGRQPRAIELLEDRLTPASFYWDGSADGSWANYQNWSMDIDATTPAALNVIPTSADDVFLNANISISNQMSDLGGNQAVKSITFSANSTTAITLNNNVLAIGSGGVGSIVVENGAAAHTINSGISITNSAVTWTLNNGVSSDFTVNGVVSGTVNTNNLTKAGTGKLVLGNAANTWGGSTTAGVGLVINGGIVEFTADGNLGNVNNDVTFGGGTLRYANAAANWNPAGTRTLIFGANTGTVDVVNSARSVILDDTAQITAGTTGVLVKAGSGVLAVSGANTSFDGTLRVDTGVVSMSGATSAVGDGTNRATLLLNGGTVSVDSDSSVYFSAILGLNANSTLINNRATPGAAFAAGTSSGFNSFLVNGNYDLTVLTGSNVTSGEQPVTIANGATPTTGIGTLNGTVTFKGNSAFVTVTVGVWAGTGGVKLHSSFTGRVALFGPNTFGGGVTVDGGILHIAGSDSSPATLNATVATSPVGKETLTLNGGTLQVGNAPRTLSNPVVFGPGATVDFSKNNGTTAAGFTFFGPTTFQGGTTTIKSYNQPVATGITGFSGVSFSGTVSFAEGTNLVIADAGGSNINAPVTLGTTPTGAGINLASANNTGTPTAKYVAATIASNSTAAVTLQGPFSAGFTNQALQIATGSGAITLGTLNAGTNNPGISINNSNSAGVVIASGNGTFTGGVVVESGLLSIQASSTPSTLNAAVTSGPLGTGTLTLRNGATVLSDDAARTVANSLIIDSGASVNFRKRSGTTAGTTLIFNGSTTLTGGSTTLSVFQPTGVTGFGLQFGGTVSYAEGMTVTVADAGGSNTNIGATFGSTAGAGSGNTLASTNATGTPTAPYVAASFTNNSTVAQVITGRFAGGAANQALRILNGTGPVTVGTLTASTNNPGIEVNRNTSALTTFGSNATFTGGVTLTNGTIAIGADSTGPDNSSAFTAGPLGLGTFRIASGTLQSTSGTARYLQNNAILTGGTVNFTGTGDVSFTGLTQSISGATTINVNATSNFRLGTATPNAPAAVNGATITLAADFNVNINSSGSFTLNNGAIGTGVPGSYVVTGDRTINVAASSNSNTGNFNFFGPGSFNADALGRTLTINTTFTPAAATSGIQIGSLRGGAGNLDNKPALVINSDINSTGTVTFSGGSPSYTGGTTVHRGTAIIASTLTAGVAWSTGAKTLGTMITPGNGYAYEVTTAGTSGGTAPTFTTVVGALLNDGSVVYTVRAAAYNAMGTGPVTLNGGTLRTDGTARTITNGITIAGDITLGAATGSNNLTITPSSGGYASTTTLSGPRTITVAGGSHIINGIIAGNSGPSLTKDGGFDLAFANNTATASSYGDVVINAGRLFMSATSNANFQRTLGSGAYQINSGGTLGFNDDIAKSPTNVITLASGGNITNRTNTLTLASATTNLPTAGTVIFNQDDQSTGAITILSPIASTGDLTIQIGNLYNSSQNGNGGTATFSGAGVISGAANITKTGNGILIMSASHSYSGTTTVIDGTLRAGASVAPSTNGPFGNSATPVVIGNTGIANEVSLLERTPTTNSTQTAALSYATETALDAINGAAGTENYFSLYRGKLTVASSGVWSFGTRSDDGSVIWIDLDNDGIFSVAGVNGNELIVNNNFSQGATARTGNATLAAGTYNFLIGFFASTAPNTFEARFSSAGGDIPYTSQTIIQPNDAGQAGLWSDLSSTADQLSASYFNFTPRTINNVSYGLTRAAAVDIGGSFTVAREITAAGGSPILSNSTGSGNFTGNVVFNRDTTVSVGGTTLTMGTGVISGSGSLTKSGSGALTLSNPNNTYAGATLIYNGMVSTSADGNLGLAPLTPTANKIVIGNAGTLRATASYTLDANRLIAVGGNVSAATLTTPALDASTGVTWNINSIISDSTSGVGGLTKAGAGLINLTSVNTYTGTTSVNAGTLAITQNGGLGTAAGGVSISAGGVLDLQNVAYTNAETTTLNGGTLRTSTGTSSLAGNIVLNANSTIDVTGTQLTANGSISLGYSTLTTSGAGNFVALGNIFDAGASAAGLRQGLLSGAFDVTTPNLSGVIVLKPEAGYTTTSWPTGAWAENVTWVYTGQFFDADGVVSFAENMDDSAWVSIDGVVRINNGTYNTITKTGTLNLTPGWHDIEIRFGNGTTIGGPTAGGGWTTSKGFGWSAAGIDSTDGALYSIFQDPGDGSLMRVALPTTSLIKNGTGTLTLSGTNTYNGGTTINGGSVVATVAEPFGGNPTSTLTVSGLGTNVTLFDNAAATTTVGTVDLSNSNGVFNTGAGKLVVKSQLKLLDGYNAAGDFTAQGADLANNNAARTLTAVAGALNLTHSNAIAIVDSGSRFTNSSSSNNTFSNFVVSPAADILVVTISSRSDVPNHAPTTITYGGLPLTAAASSFGTVGTYVNSQIYYLYNPPAGVADLIVNYTGVLASNYAIYAFTLGGLDTSYTPLGGNVANTEGSPTAQSVTINGVPAGAWAIGDATYRIGTAGNLTATTNNGTLLTTGVGGGTGNYWRANPTDGGTATIIAAGAVASNLTAGSITLTETGPGASGSHFSAALAVFAPGGVTAINLPNTSIVATGANTLDLGLAGAAHTLGTLSTTNGATLSLQNGTSLTAAGVGTADPSGPGLTNAGGLDLSLTTSSTFEVTGGSGPNGASDKVNGVNVLTYGGTLKVTNIGSAFAGGDSWNLFDFSSQSGTFANNAVFGTNGDGVNLPLLSGAVWAFDYTTGILSVVATTPAPTVTSIVPAIGPTTGGTMLLINGSNFVSITTVTIDGTPLATFSVSGTTQISVTTTAHAAGAVDVVVTNGGGSASLAGANDFTYATPAIASVVVNGGPGVVLGGSTWSLAGQNSVVKQILVTFNQAVTLASDAFTVTPVPVSPTPSPGPGFVYVGGGAAPSSAAVTATIAATLSPSSYLVTFSGPGTHAGGGINSGVYDLTTIASKVSANTETMASNRVDTFFAMFGTINANDSLTSGTIGDGFSNAFVDPGSLFQFSDAFGSSAATPVGPPAYNIVFDSNLDGFIDPGDLFAFSDAFGIDWDF